MIADIQAGRCKRGIPLPATLRIRIFASRLALNDCKESIERSAGEPTLTAWTHLNI